MSQKELQEKRNETTRCIELGDRGRLNSIRFGINETKEHFDKKCQIAWALRCLGKHFYTEAVLVGKKVVVDVLVLDDYAVIEIQHTESDESIESKKERIRKFGLEVEVVKC
jgi:competence CoiA-like predicted nuclease